MKKITLLFTLLITAFGFSQDLLLGFEGGESGGVDGGPFGGMAAPVIEAGTGSNTSQVLKIVGNSGTDVWQGINLNLTDDVDLTSTNSMTIDVKSATAITFLVKVNDGTGDEAAAAVTHNGDNTWQTLAFTFDTSLDGKAAMANGEYNGFVIHAYWAPGATVFGDVTKDERTFYVDNISGPKSTNTCLNGMQDGDETGVDCGGSCPNACPNPPASPSTTPPNRAPANVVALYSNAYTEVESDNSSTPQTFGSAVTSEIDLSGNTVFSFTTPDNGSGLQYQFFGTTPQYLDLSLMTTAHIDFYFEGSPSAVGTILILIAQYSDGTNIQKNFDVTSLASNTWHEMDVDFANFDGNPGYARDQIQQVIVQVAGAEGSLTGPVYFDNLYFHNKMVLGTEDFNALELELYPNPTTTRWNIKAKQNVTNVAVYDILGKEVLRLKPNTRDVEIDARSLKTGLYFARINSDSGSSTLKLVKQ